MSQSPQRGHSWLTKMAKENPEKYPSRMGAPWTDDEDSQLINKIRDNLEISEIANKHGRTQGAIKSRQRDLAVEMVLEEKIPISTVCRTMRLTEAYLSQIINHRKQAQEAKAQKSTNKKTGGKKAIGNSEKTTELEERITLLEAQQIRIILALKEIQKGLSDLNSRYPKN